MVATGAGILGSAISYSQQKSAYDAQVAYQEEYNQKITEATIDNYKELSKTEQAILYNAGQDSLENQINYLQAKGTMDALTAATGVQGRSSDMIFNDLVLKRDQEATNIRMYRDESLDNVNAQAEQLQENAEASYDTTPIQKPSVWDSLSYGVNMGISTGQLIEQGKGLNSAISSASGLTTRSS